MMYGNQAEIGQAMTEVFKEGKVKRDEVWMTSKVCGRVPPLHLRSSDLFTDQRRGQSMHPVLALLLCAMSWRAAVSFIYGHQCASGHSDEMTALDNCHDFDPDMNIAAPCHVQWPLMSDAISWHTVWTMADT